MGACGGKQAPVAEPVTAAALPGKLPTLLAAQHQEKSHLPVKAEVSPTSTRPTMLPTEEMSQEQEEVLVSMVADTKSLQEEEPCDKAIEEDEGSAGTPPADAPTKSLQEEEPCDKATDEDEGSAGTPPADAPSPMVRSIASNGAEEDEVTIVQVERAEASLASPCKLEEGGEDNLPSLTDEGGDLSVVVAEESPAKEEYHASPTGSMAATPSPVRENNGEHDLSQRTEEDQAATAPEVPESAIAPPEAKNMQRRSKEGTCC